MKIDKKSTENKRKNDSLFKLSCNITYKIITNKTSNILKQSYQVGFIPEMKRCNTFNAIPMKITAAILFYRNWQSFIYVEKCLELP